MSRYACGRTDAARGHASLLAAATLLALALPGCALLRVTETEARVAAIEKSQDAQRTDLERERKRLERLRKEAEESTTYLRQNGARIGARLDDLDEAIRRSRGELELINHKLAALSRQSGADHAAIEQLRARLDRLIADLRDRAGIAILALPRELPEHADDWVTLAQRHFDEGEVRVADAVARECRKRFAGTEQAGRCGLLIGRIAYEEHRFGDAIETYRGVHDALGGKAVPVVGRALLGIAEVMAAQGKCNDAAEVLKYLRTLLKKGAESQEAKRRLDGWKALCTDGKIALPAPTWGSKKPTSSDGAGEGGAASSPAAGATSGGGAGSAGAAPGAAGAASAASKSPDSKAAKGGATDDRATGGKATERKPDASKPDGGKAGSGTDAPTTDQAPSERKPGQEPPSAADQASEDGDDDGDDDEQGAGA